MQSKLKRWASFSVTAMLAGSIADRFGMGWAHTIWFILVMEILILPALLSVASWSEGR